MDDEGIHGTAGRDQARDGSSAGAIRFVIRKGSSAQFLGRRQHIRSALTAPIVLTAEGSSEKFGGRTMNVSEGGMLVGDLAARSPAPARG